MVEDDPDRRLEFCETKAERIVANRLYLQHICFSDESTFYLNGNVNTQNRRYWSDENPHESREGHTQFPQKINVWAGILGNHILGPIFLEENLNGPRYLQMLQDTISPSIDEIVTQNPHEFYLDVTFQQDGAPPHYFREVRNYLDERYPVHEVFKNVAEDYDVMNDAMSLGIHRIWKDVFVYKLSATNTTRLLDVAGGTGDIAFRFLNQSKINGLKDCHVTVCDINENMLKVGKIRSKNLNHDPETIAWQEGNAEQLPYHDNSFDAYTIAFGIRNVTRIDRVLEEAYRVLQPGGRFMCLEFSHLINPTAQWLYDQYSFQVIPVLGQVIAGQWKPYQYLVESIRQFPNQENFKLIIEEAGFRQVTYENLSLGVVAIHSGFKL